MRNGTTEIVDPKSQGRTSGTVPVIRIRESSSAKRASSGAGRLPAMAKEHAGNFAWISGRVSRTIQVALWLLGIQSIEPRNTISAIFLGIGGRSKYSRSTPVGAVQTLFAP